MYFVLFVKLYVVLAALLLMLLLFIVLRNVVFFSVLPILWFSASTCHHVYVFVKCIAVRLSFSVLRLAWILLVFLYFIPLVKQPESSQHITDIWLPNYAEFVYLAKLHEPLVKREKT